MQYHIQFSNLQRAADTLRTVAHAMKRGNVAPGCRTWSVAYNSIDDGVEVFASCDSKALVVFSSGEVVFVTNSSGEICRFHPGPWIESVDSLYDDAVTAGYMAPPDVSCRSLSEAELEEFCPDFSNVSCPWLDAIEATKDPWDLTV